MANAIFKKGRQAFAQAQVNWVSDTIKVILLDTGAQSPAINTDTMQFLSEIDGPARIATATLTSRTAADGVLDAADTTFPTVSGNQSEALLIYKDTGVEGTSPLLVYIDVATGLSVIPNGGDIRIEWPAGGIATL